MEKVKTYCKLCNCRCGIIAHVDKGKILKIEGDRECQKNEGALCIKGRSMLELLYDEDRLKAPLKRKGKEWEEISWGKAINEIAERLILLKEKYGPEALGIYRGMSVYSWLIAVFLNRFSNIYGTPNVFSNSALCVSSKIFGTKLTFGDGVSSCGDFRNSKCILLFGTNPAVTGMHRAIRVMKDILYAKKQGAHLIVVDPRYTETARKADIHTTIRPGTDLAFILSLIKVIIDNDWYDKDFVEKYTLGFESLKEHVKKYTPEYAEKITWIKKEVIIKIARIFALSESACADRREGILHHENGTITCHAIDILNAITGNIDVKGGIHLQTNLFDKGSSLFKKLTHKDKLPSDVFPVSKERPLSKDFPVDLLRAILEEKPYPIKALMIIGSNPVLSWPNSGLVEKALKKLELTVVIDIYKNDTATFADYILPASTFLEKKDIQTPNVALPRVVQLQKKVIEPLNNTRCEFEIIKDLAEKMGYGRYFQEDQDDIISKILAQWNLSLNHLYENESGFIFEPRSPGYYHKNPYPTPSGKIELSSSRLDQIGVNPLPEFKEPSESHRSRPDIAEKFPLVLVTGNRLMTTYLSFLHNLPTLHDKSPENRVLINTSTARELGVKDGEMVMVESPRGEIEIIAKVSDEADPGVVFIPYGWGHKYNADWKLANRDPGVNVNKLLSNEYVDNLSGMPNYKSTLCRISKIS